MREILFRGKRIEDGEWVYGYYSKEPDGKEYLLADIGDTWDSEHLLSYVDVITETVGQYTGLLDKNGKKIFEGDVVVAWSAGHRATGEVKHRIDGLWLMYPAYQHGKQWGLCPNPKGETTVEIIGNIHEEVQE